MWTDDDRALRDGGDGSAPATIVLEEGSLLARKYRLDRTAGFGGMAQLWVATNEATGAEVCIKILVPDSFDDDSVQRFRREAYAAARLSHRAIVRIFDLVELNAAGEDTTAKPVALAIVMELLRGETLGDYLMKKGKLSLAESIDLALPILSALAHAHRAGIVHRDLKPDNIFLATDPDGHVIPKVLDFGVSKVAPSEKQSRGSAPLTLDGVMLGTPSFMSPEQARGARNVDARSDVFSAAILFYMLLAGKNPFESESFHSVISAVLERDPPPLPDVPEAIWAVIEKGLAKDAAARYADATELGIALRRACGRSAATESGVHAVAVPASGRKSVTPLGGDSLVSVPPVGNGGDTASNPAPPGSTTPAARKRAVRIVVAVVAASVALTTVALLRGPPGASSPPSATGDLSPSMSTAARATAAPSTTAAPTTTGAPTTGAPTSGATMTAATSAKVAADAGLAPQGGRTVTGTAATQGVKKPAPSGTAVKGPDGSNEPRLVRDPGF